MGYRSVDGNAAIEELPDVRLSPDAGNFLCGFTYFNSLAHYYTIKEDEMPVVFLHVPDLSSSEGKLREGWEVTVALIKALVESRRKLGVIREPIEVQTGTYQEIKRADTDNNFA